MEKTTLQPDIEAKAKKRYPTWEDIIGKVGQAWREKIRPHISYNRHPLAFTLIAFSLIFIIAVTADQVQARRPLLLLGK